MRPAYVRSCLVLGSGRSGSSMVAGSLSRSGYFMGDNLFRGNGSNPKGFFEDREVTTVNERLLAGALRPRPRGPLARVPPFRARPGERQRWLATLPVERDVPCPPGLGARIAALTARRPFCFKDPRFSYTLPAWRPYLDDDEVAYVCVFRHPATSAESMVRERAQAPYLRSLSLSIVRALRVWTLMYRHVLERHRHSGTWVFVHYDQVLAGSGIERIEGTLGVAMDRDFPDPSLTLKQSPNGRRVPSKTAGVYAELCRLAGYEGGP